MITQSKITMDVFLWGTHSNNCFLDLLYNYCQYIRKSTYLWVQLFFVYYNCMNKTAVSMQYILNIAIQAINKIFLTTHLSPYWITSEWLAPNDIRLCSWLFDIVFFLSRALCRRCILSPLSQVWVKNHTRQFNVEKNVGESKYLCRIQFYFCITDYISSSF